MKKKISVILIVLLVISVLVILNPNAKYNVERYIKNNSAELTEYAEDLLSGDVSVTSKYNG